MTSASVSQKSGSSRTIAAYGDSHAGGGAGTNDGSGWVLRNVKVCSSAERDVNSERLAVHLAGKPALGTEPQPVILHPVVPDLRVIIVGADLEGHEVAERRRCSSACLKASGDE